MATQHHIRPRNRLLLAMTAESFALLHPHLESVDLAMRQPLVEPNAPTQHVHFLESGLASIVAIGRDEDEQIEVGHIGREGMTGAHIVLRAEQTPNRTFVQAVGTAWRLPAERLSDAMDDDKALARLLLRYVQTYEVQLSHSALANGRYSMRERLARWLLMCHDRLDGDDLPLTHEFLSLMLGVRRSGVTDEVHVLEGLGLIRATRGHIKLLDRTRMEEVAGGCYGLPEREYDRLIGAKPPVGPSI